jgi:hypothetical protein
MDAPSTDEAIEPTTAESAGQSVRGGTVALVVAAGRGARFGGTTPKQYLNLAGQPLLRHSARSSTRTTARTMTRPPPGSIYCPRFPAATAVRTRCAAAWKASRRCSRTGC